MWLWTGFLAMALAQDGVVIQGKVTASGRGEHTIIVYVDGEGPAFDAPVAADVRQKDRQFAPGAVVVSPGAEVRFPNEDNVLHNVFSLTPGAEFDLEEYGGGESRSTKLAQSGEVEVYCNRHEDMAMKILVVPNRWYAEVAADGSFRIEGVTPGPHTLVAWSPGHWEQRQQIEAKAALAPVEFALKKRPQDVPHTNKYGLPYYR